MWWVNCKYLDGKRFLLVYEGELVLSRESNTSRFEGVVVVSLLQGQFATVVVQTVICRQVVPEL